MARAGVEGAAAVEVGVRVGVLRIVLDRLAIVRDGTVAVAFSNRAGHRDSSNLTRGPGASVEISAMSISGTSLKRRKWVVSSGYSRPFGSSIRHALRLVAGVAVSANLRCDVVLRTFCVFRDDQLR